MPLNVKAGGSWVAASKVHVKVSGAWQAAKELWGYMSGGWRSAWQNEIRYVNTSNRTAASIYELMGSPTEPGDYVFENTATISAGTGSYALRTGVFPAGSTLAIINKGYILGKGGSGGTYDGAGGSGGTALHIDMNCTIDNGSGYIYGGGGGGGGAQWYYDNSFYIRTGGGGGAGSNGGSAGSPNSKGNGAGSNWLVNTNCTAGSASSGGDGGVARAGLDSSKYDEVRGGAGGGLGASGGASSKAGGSGTKGNNPSLYSGGSAGAAIARNGKAIYITAGDNTTQIKGAIA